MSEPGGNRFKVIERPGSKVLYPAATGLEKAMADVDSERVIRIPDWKIQDMWDAYEIDLENLPILAWGMQARMWEDGWTESTKREWTAEQWKFQALRGTRAGIEMALKFMGRDFTGGYDLLEVLTAPQGFYASPDLTKDEMDAWIRQMPQIRIKLAHGYGVADGEFYVGNVTNATEGFSEFNHAARDDGWQLYGRRAVLRRPGQQDQDLGMVEWETRTENRQTIDFITVSIPGKAGSAICAEDIAVNDDQFADGDELAPQLFSIRRDGSYDHVSSQLHLSMLTPGLEPINVQYDRDSDIGWGNSFIFDGDLCEDDGTGCYADNGRDAFEMLADRIYLLDPTIAAPLMAGTSFVGVDRVDYPPYHAELLVDLITKDRLPSWYASETALVDTFVVPEDLDDFDRALRATVASKALRDKVGDDFAVTHPLAWGDVIKQETRFGDQPRSWL